MTTATKLINVGEAAKILGVPKGSLETAAKLHGYIVRMGRTPKIYVNDLEELIIKCRENPLEPVFIGEKTKKPTSFVTLGVPNNQQAQAAAKMLKNSSRRT